MASGSVVKIRPNIGYATETLTVTNAVQVLTPSIYAPNQATPGGAEVAFVTNYGAAIRYYYDGSTPSASVGHVLPDGGIITLTGQNQLQSFKAFRLSAVDSVLTITYERE
jgi:hypothetical protein